MRREKLPNRPLERDHAAIDAGAPQTWSFFRYGLDRISSMPCSLQKPINTSRRRISVGGIQTGMGLRLRF